MLMNFRTGSLAPRVAVPSLRQIAAFRARGPVSPALAGKPFDLAIGEWWQVPDVGNSQLADVYASPAPAGDQAAIMYAWGSAALDTLRKRVFVWNGGHLDYAGNEGYIFDLDPESGTYLTWFRNLYYSTADTNDDETYSDGSPAARHVYASLEYHPVLDKYFFGPGCAIYDSGAFTRGVWGLDAAVNSPNAASPGSWTRYDDLPAGIDDADASQLAWDSEDGLFYHNHHGTNGGLASFDPTLGAGSQWTIITNGSDNGLVQWDPTCIAHTTPKRHCFAVNGLSTLVVRRLDTNAWEGSESAFGLTGDTNIFQGVSVGIQWDDTLQKLVCWGGTRTGGTDNRDVYTVDLGTKVVSRITGTGDTPDNPTNGGSGDTGTFGRWRNLSSLGAAWAGLYLLVNSTTSHVYFYRAS